MIGLPLDFSSHIAERARDFTGREWVFKGTLAPSWLALSVLTASLWYLLQERLLMP